MHTPPILRSPAVPAIGALFLAGALGLEPAAAQSPGQGASKPAPFRPSSSLLDRAVAGRLEPHTWTYVARLMRGGPSTRLGFRRLRLVRASYAGEAAWLVIDARQMATVTLAESLYVARSDLAPLHQVVRGPGREVVTDYAADSIRARFDDAEGEVRIAMPNEPGLLANLYLAELLLGASPLGERWRGSARLVAIGREGGGVVPIEVAVVGEESILVPDGTFDCWVVVVRAGTGGSGERGAGEQRVWVRKSDGVVLKERIPVLGMDGAEVELLLARSGVRAGEGEGP